MWRSSFAIYYRVSDYCLRLYSKWRLFNESRQVATLYCQILKSVFIRYLVIVLLSLLSIWLFSLEKFFVFFIKRSGFIHIHFSPLLLFFAEASVHCILGIITCSKPFSNLVVLMAKYQSSNVLYQNQNGLKLESGFIHRSINYLFTEWMWAIERRMHLQKSNNIVTIIINCFLFLFLK